MKKNNYLVYPRITEIGLAVIEEPYPHIPNKLLQKALKKHKLSVKQFSKFFGVQTCLALDNGDSGLYPWDVEAVLERMKSGKLTGTQLHWD